MADDIPSLEVRIKGFFNNRLAGALKQLLEDLYDATGIEPHPSFEKGILLAQNPDALNTRREDHPSLTSKERIAVDLDREPDKSPSSRQRRLIPNVQNNDFSKWRDLPWPMWKLVILCALSAGVQGWDEAAINGAQIWFQQAFGIYIIVPIDVNTSPRPNIVGLVNGAPYLCCVVSCWFTPWLNDKLGRRGTIFWCALFSIFFALAQAFAQSWQQLFAFRMLMGLGIGPKSATVPIYAAECAPANIRGSLVMFWQVWTAFGIMAGCISGVALQHLGSVSAPEVCPRGDPQKLLSWQCSQNWRLILGSPAILPIVLAAYIYGCCESPRWTIAKAHTLRKEGRLNRSQIFYQKAFRALNDLSRDRVLAARDMVSHYYLLENEKEELVTRQDLAPDRSWLSNEFYELFVDRRNRRAIMASLVCMFAQQFCGVNFIIYYSNVIFQQITLPPGTKVENATSAQLLGVTENALLYTMGFGVINLLFAIPAFFTIDTVGRRTLLLSTFLFLALAHIITAIALAIKIWQMALVGMYLFGVFYSPGEGPVPFVYASESMPLHIREKGMAFVVSINWLLNWFIAFSGPNFIEAFKPAGTFVWYAAWCVLLWFAILLLVAETRLLTLEQLDFVFRKVSAFDFAKHSWKQLLWHVRLRDERPKGLYEEPGGEEKNQGSSINGSGRPNKPLDPEITLVSTNDRQQ